MEIKNKVFFQSALKDIPTNIPVDKQINKVLKLADDWGFKKKQDRIDALLEWVIFRDNAKNYEVKTVIEDLFPTEIKNLVDAVDRYKSRRAKILKEEKAQYKKIVDARKKLEEWTPYQTTKFIQQSIFVEYKIEMFQDALELFNSVQLPQNVPPVYN